MGIGPGSGGSGGNGGSGGKGGSGGNGGSGRGPSVLPSERRLTAPPASADALPADDWWVLFDGLAHRVARPGVLLGFPHRIAITHASRRLTMIGRPAHPVIQTARVLRLRQDASTRSGSR
jgi:hypothetical protein